MISATDKRAAGQAVTAGLPSPIVTALQQVRQSVLISELAAAVLRAIAIGLGLLLSAMLLDACFVWQSRPIRGVTGVVVVGVPLAIVLRGAWCGWKWSRELVRAARLIDRSTPTLEERLTTLVQTHGRLETPSDRFMKRLIDEVGEQEINPEAAVARAPLRRAAYAAAGALAVFVIGCGLFRGEALTLVARALMPWRDLSLTQITRVTGDTRAVAYEPLAIEVELAGRVPSEVELQIRSQADRPDSINSQFAAALPDDSDRFLCTVANVRNDFEYRIMAGDSKSAWHRVRVVQRPRFERLRVRVTPPEYTKQDPWESGEMPRHLRVLNGSRLEIGFAVPSPSARAEIRYGGSKEPVASQRGEFLHVRDLTESMTMSLHLFEQPDIFSRHVPECFFDVFSDRAPNVSLLDVDDDLAIRPDDILDIRFQADDDYGISRAELLVYRIPSDGLHDTQSLDTATVLPIDLGEQAGAKRIKMLAKVVVKTLNLQVGDEFQYAVRITDNRQQAATAAMGPNSDVAAEASTSEPAATNRAANSRGNTATDVPIDSTSASDVVDRGPPPRGDATDQQPNHMVSSDEGAKTSPGPFDQAHQSEEPWDASSQMDVPTAERSAALDRSDPRLNSDASGAPGAEKPEALNRKSGLAAQPVSGDHSLSGPGRREMASNPSRADSRTASRTADDRQNRPPSASAEAGMNDQMSRRTLDVGQSTTSTMMNVRIDQFVGTFSGRRREKLEIAIAAVLTDLDKLLAEAQQSLEHHVAVEAIGDQQRFAIAAASRSLDTAESSIHQLSHQAQGTPYDFIAMQIQAIAYDDVRPAQDQLLEMTASHPTGANVEGTGIARPWSHIVSAREQLAALNQEFETVRREHLLADATERIQRMYRVFVEDAYALLETNPGSINRFQRRVGEVELSDEQLERIKEVEAMRHRLMAEIAKLLRRDPRLMRRYLDNLRDTSRSFRDRLTLLAERQMRIARQLGSWSDLPAEVVNRLSRGQMLQRQVMDAESIAQDLSEFYRDFETWLPLNQRVDDPSVKTFLGLAGTAAATARTIGVSSAQLLAQPHPESSESVRREVDSEADRDSDSEAEPGGSATLTPERITSDVQTLGDDLEHMMAMLPHLVDGESNAQTRRFIANRISQLQQIRRRLTLWQHTFRALEGDNYHQFLLAHQQNLRSETTRYAQQIAEIPAEISNLLMESPEQAELVGMAEALVERVQGKLIDAQLAVELGLRAKQTRRSNEALVRAIREFEQAEATFDELLKRIYAALDQEAPSPADPREPFLDELLALLGAERELFDSLRLEANPLNLTIISDWLSSGGMLGAIGGIGRDRGRPRGHGRGNANDGAAVTSLTEAPTAWNTLVSKLRDELLQGNGNPPPEEYREAIEAYFERLSTAP